MPGKSPAEKPAEEPTDDAAEAAEEPQFANRAERRAAKGKGSSQQQTFGQGKVTAKGNSGPTQRIWSNRKAG